MNMLTSCASGTIGLLFVAVPASYGQAAAAQGALIVALEWKDTASETSDGVYSIQPQRISVVKTGRDGTKVPASYETSGVALAPGKTYQTELPELLRNRYRYLELSYVDVVGKSPSESTVVNADGAIFTFIRFVTANGTELPMRELVVFAGLDGNGEEVWTRPGYLTAFAEPGTYNAAVPFGIRFDYGASTWSMTRKGQSVASNLPLFATEGRPTMLIRTPIPPKDSQTGDTSLGVVTLLEAPDVSPSDGAGEENSTNQKGGCGCAIEN